MGNAVTITTTLDLSYRQKGSAKPALTGTCTIATTFTGSSKKLADQITSIAGAEGANAPSILFLPDFVVTGNRAEGSKPNPFRHSLVEFDRLQLDEHDPHALQYVGTSKLKDAPEKPGLNLKMVRVK